MVTITVGGINSRSAPSPIQRRSWTDDWGPQLAGLTAWVGNADSTSFSCTVPAPATVNQVEGVVDGDLNQWQEQDFGHRHYSVT
jgi:hypothetical protein